MSPFIDLICPPGMTLGPNLYMTGQLSLESCLLTGTLNQPAVTQHSPCLAFWVYFRPFWCLGTPRVGVVGQEKALAIQVLHLSSDFLKWRPSWMPRIFPIGETGLPRYPETHPFPATSLFTLVRYPASQPTLTSHWACPGIEP